MLHDWGLKWPSLPPWVLQNGRTTLPISSHFANAQPGSRVTWQVTSVGVNGPDAQSSVQRSVWCVNHPAARGNIWKLKKVCACWLLHFCNSMWPAWQRRVSLTANIKNFHVSTDVPRIQTTPRKSDRNPIFSIPSQVEVARDLRHVRQRDARLRTLFSWQPWTEAGMGHTERCWWDWSHFSRTLAIGTRSFLQKISKVSGAKPISYFRPAQTRLPEIQWQFLGLFCPCFLEAQAEEWEQQGKKLKAGVSPHNTSLPGHRSNSNSSLASLVSWLCGQLQGPDLKLLVLSASSTPPILLWWKIQR